MTLRRRIAGLQSFLRQRQEALCFDDIPDPRDPRGIRWPLVTLLSTAMWGLLTVGRSLRAAEELSEDLADAGKRLRIPRRVPDSTLGDALSRLDPEPLRDHLRQCIRAEHRRKALAPTVLPIGVVSIDGKEVARTKTQCHAASQEQTGPDGRPQFSFRVLNASLISAAAPVCIDQMPIPADTNEMGAFAKFFGALVAAYQRSALFEALVTDAGMTSETNARLVDAQQLGYVMALKGNQPELQREACRVMSALTLRVEPEAQTDWQSDSSRGIIRHQIFRTVEMAGWGAWSHLRQVWLVRVLRRPANGGHEPIQILEERFYLTNLPTGRLDAAQCMRLVRAHWRIENVLHGTLDLQWQEDYSRWVRRGQGLPVCALLRALAFNLLAVLRAVHLRSDAAREVTWRRLRDWVRDCLLHPLVLPAAGDIAKEVAQATP
ncbi:MAG: ISAs1 family transposase, partial [Chloroflexales bacterium]